MTWDVYGRFHLYLDDCTFKKQKTGRVDYAFHAYNEVCHFIYCLLPRSRVVSGLPQMDDWEAYMDPSKLKNLEKISSEDFLKSYEFGTELHRANTGELCEFRNRCREFVDHLVDVILAQQVVSSDFFQGLYCFCPELLLEGDDRHVFQLFSRLLLVLERCGVIQSGVARTSLEEFTTFVVDARARHRDSGRSAEEISDIVSHLLDDYSFMSRRDLARVLKICSLVVARPRISMPKIEIDLDRCAVPASVIMSSLRGVQSLVLSANYKQGAFSHRGLWRVSATPSLVVASLCQVPPLILGRVCVVVAHHLSQNIRLLLTTTLRVRRRRQMSNCTTPIVSLVTSAFRSLVVHGLQVCVVPRDLLLSQLCHVRLLRLGLLLLVVLKRRDVVQLWKPLHCLQSWSERRVSGVLLLRVRWVL